MLLVRDVVGCYRRVMAVSVRNESLSTSTEYGPDLFRNQLGRASLILPLPKKQFAQEGI
jgi:hypothetical protein